MRLALPKGPLRVLPLLVVALAAGAPSVGSLDPAGAAPLAHGQPAAAAAFVYWNTNGVDPTMSYDSAGGTPSVSGGGTGVFTVTFPNLAAASGDVQVSAARSPSVTCRVVSWGPSAADLVAKIYCTSGTVPYSAAAFLALFTSHSGSLSGPVYDYAQANNASGNLIGPDDYNSAGKTNSLNRVGTGRYVVSFPGPLATGPDTGTAEVTTYGATLNICQISSWSATTAGATTTHKVGVYCYDFTGAPADTAFDIVYARGTSILGLAGQPAANAFASDASAAATLYEPAVQWDSHAGARIAVIHLDRGIYQVVALGTSPSHHLGGGNGDWQFTGYGSSPVNCAGQFVSTHQPYAYVQCSNIVGNLVNASFFVQWVVGQ